ncbi:hypothetical protein BDR05DRAFT_999333 [Suillus weaverae]|nr:hypothetical protein BDR05DRAFT_999333 [Suillus weaverae]
MEASWTVDTFDDQCTTSHDSSEVKAFATSPSKSRQAILREASGKRFVEIWAGTQLLEASLDVSNYHQAFLTDDFLYSLPFSPNETSLLYTTEASVDTDDDPYNKFRYNPTLAIPPVQRNVLPSFYSAGPDPPLSQGHLNKK